MFEVQMEDVICPYAFTAFLPKAHSSISSLNSYSRYHMPLQLCSLSLQDWGQIYLLSVRDEEDQGLSYYCSLLDFHTFACFSQRLSSVLCLYFKPLLTPKHRQPSLERKWKMLESSRPSRRLPQLGIQEKRRKRLKKRNPSTTSSSLVI